VQSMAYDMRPMIRWAQKGPEETEDGDVLMQFSKGTKVLRLAFTPMPKAQRLDPHGIMVDETRYRVTCPRGYGFVPGDRLGPAGSTEPTMEVVTTMDYRTHIRMEVRPL